MRPSTKTYIGLVAMLLLATGIVHQWNPPIIDRMRAIAFDSYQRMAPRTYDPSLPVRIVDIDEKSLKARGQWPWPRKDMAELVDRLDKMGAVAIVFDMVFAEGDRLSPQEISKQLQDDPNFAVVAEALSQKPSNDQIFADVIARTGTVMGFVASPDVTSGDAPKVVSEIEHNGDDPGRYVPTYPGAVVNLPMLMQGAHASGFINWIAEQDQIIRKLPLLLQIGDKLYPSIAAEGLRVAQGVSNYLVVASGAEGERSFGARTGIVKVLIGNATVPTDAHGQMWLKFTRSDPRRYISAQSVFDGKVAQDDVKGRIILIGTSAAGLLDIRATPLDAAVPGVEAHAQAIEQMFVGDYLNRPDFAVGSEIVFSLVIGTILAWAVFRSGAAAGFALGAVAVAFVAGVSWLAFRRAGWLLDPVFPTLSLTTIYIAASGFLRLRSERERNSIRHAFGHYMSPAQVEKLAADPSGLELGGVNRDLTILFADVHGFTRRSEGMDPQSLTRFVIDLFTPLSNTIISFRGTIDKFIGDAVMAFWNAPLDDAEHASNACRAALQMLKNLRDLNEGWASAVGPNRKPINKSVSIGIGLNSGICCVGNFGSAQRFDYSAIGNDVNLASRFENLTRYYDLPILVGLRTALGASEMALIEVDLISVKGYERPVRLFALLGDEQRRQDPAFQDLAETQQKLLKAFRSQQFEEALNHLEELKRLAPELSRLWEIYQQRIVTLKRDSPPLDWDGRSTAEMK